MSRILLVLVFLLSLTSCDKKPDLNKVPPAPEKLMNEEAFTQVMVDVEILEATLKLKLIRKPDIRDRIMVYYDQIFDRHGITEKQFRDNLEFYNKQAAKIAVIYDSVQVRLGRMKADLKLEPDTTNALGNRRRTQ